MTDKALNVDSPKFNYESLSKYNIDIYKMRSYPGVKISPNNWTSWLGEYDCCVNKLNGILRLAKQNNSVLTGTPEDTLSCPNSFCNAHEN